jgi:hypothetical protein
MSCAQILSCGGHPHHGNDCVLMRRAGSFSHLGDVLPLCVWRSSLWRCGSGGGQESHSDVLGPIPALGIVQRPASSFRDTRSRRNGGF